MFSLDLKDLQKPKFGELRMGDFQGRGFSSTFGWLRFASKRICYGKRLLTRTRHFS